MQQFDAPNLSRNPILHVVFSRMKMAEERGFGMITWRNIAVEFGLRLPEYEFKDPNLVLTFYRESVLKSLSGSELAGWDWARIQPKSFSSSDYETGLDVSDRTARRQLSKLKEVGLLDQTRIGNDVSYETRRSSE